MQQLATDGDMRPIDVGPLRSRTSWRASATFDVAVQPGLGTNYASALKVVA